jgi:hypothetical protein
MHRTRTYKFICNVPGHKPAGMVGTLVVPYSGLHKDRSVATSAIPREAGLRATRDLMLPCTTA